MGAAGFIDNRTILEKADLALADPVSVKIVVA